MNAALRLDNSYKAEACLCVRLLQLRAEGAGGKVQRPHGLLLPQIATREPKSMCVSARALKLRAQAACGKAQRFHFTIQKLTLTPIPHLVLVDHLVQLLAGVLQGALH
jgi:hypothetical protein